MLTSVGLLYCSLGLTVGQGEKMPPSLKAVVKELAADPRGVKSEELIRAGMKQMTNDFSSSLADDLAFLGQLANRDQKQAGYKADLDEAFKALKAKYEQDPSALLRVLTKQAAICRDRLEDRAREQEVLELALRTQEDVRIQQGREELELALLVADNTLATSGPRSLALKQYYKVLEFPLFDKRYAKGVEDLKRLYIRAALRVVELTEEADMPKLRLHFFSQEEVVKVFPEKSKFLSSEMPDVAEFKGKMMVFLQLSIRDELLPTSPLRPAYQAVLESLQRAK